MSETRTRGDSQLLFVDNVAMVQANRESAAERWPVGGRAMVITFLLGNGRLVISGEAGMLGEQQGRYFANRRCERPPARLAIAGDSVHGPELLPKE